MSRHPELSTDDGATVVALHVQPGAGRTEVVGRYGDALKLRVAAPPERDRANQEVLALVAREFNVAAAKVSMVSGATSRQKLVKLEGVTLDAAERVVDRMLEGEPGARRR